MAKKHGAATQREFQREWGKSPTLYIARVMLGIAVMTGCWSAVTLGIVLFLTHVGF